MTINDGKPKFGAYIHVTQVLNSKVKTSVIQFHHQGRLFFPGARNVMTTSWWIINAHALISVYTIFKIAGAQISVTLCSVL